VERCPRAPPRRPLSGDRRSLGWLRFGRRVHTPFSISEEFLFLSAIRIMGSSAFHQQARHHGSVFTFPIQIAITFSTAQHGIAPHNMHNNNNNNNNKNNIDNDNNSQPRQTSKTRQPQSHPKQDRESRATGPIPPPTSPQDYTAKFATGTWAALGRPDSSWRFVGDGKGGERRTAATWKGGREGGNGCGWWTYEHREGEIDRIQ
jgi:hypothetical protein